MEMHPFTIAPCALSVPRVYLEVPLVSGAILSLDERAAHHVVRVMRLRPGDGIIVFNGQGGDYEAVLERGAPPQVRIGKFIARDAESSLSVHLAQGIARGERMDYAIQKAVELGVSTIIPLITEFCVATIPKEREEKRMAHWRGGIIAACEQSGRTRVPRLAAPLKFYPWLPTAQASLKLMFDPYATRLLAQLPAPEGDILLLIGPEGGLSDPETEAAQQVGFTAVQLGPRMLRTETAPVAALAAVQTMWGDLG